MLITDPAGGVEVSIADLLISGQQVYRFEDKNQMFHRVSGSTGSVSPYDWEGMLQALVLRIYERGLPASQGELVSDLQLTDCCRGFYDVLPVSHRGPSVQGRFL
jgi:hypothetical protein